MKLLTRIEIKKLSFLGCNGEDMEINIPNKEIILSGFSPKKSNELK
jgi:hypothetical protein